MVILTKSNVFSIKKDVAMSTTWDMISSVNTNGMISYYKQYYFL